MVKTNVSAGHASSATTTAQKRVRSSVTCNKRIGVATTCTVVHIASRQQATSGRPLKHSPVFTQLSKMAFIHTDIYM